MRSVLHAEPVVAAPPDAMRASAPPIWAAFDALYREHFRFVWRTVRRLGLEGSAIDDVVQEVFLVVHRRLGAFEGRSSPKTWLYGIVRRVVSDHRRTLRRRPALAPADAPAADVDAVACAEQGPEASAEQAERVRMLHRLLAELDDDKREVFVLAELEGLTIAEMAEALAVNPNTIASRLRAARREFEAALDRALGDEETAPRDGAPERRPR
jgi:RNA polymerase sigma-70 factor (ECF subfamily)